MGENNHAKKTVPTAPLFGTEHIRVRVGAVSTFSRIITLGAWVEKSIGLFALGYRIIGPFKVLVHDICQPT